MTRTLILGGTTEASNLARALADRGDDALFSYAGRTAAPVAQPLPTRVGGFGGVAGLLAFIAQNHITRVIDATHPFAAQMSRNAHAASTQAGIPLAAFERAPWAEASRRCPSLPTSRSTIICCGWWTSPPRRCPCRIRP